MVDLEDGVEVGAGVDGMRVFMNVVTNGLSVWDPLLCSGGYLRSERRGRQVTASEAIIHRALALNFFKTVGCKTKSPCILASGCILN
jgi:hypothetical protein